MTDPNAYAFPETSGFGTMDEADGVTLRCGRIAAQDGVALFYRAWVRKGAPVLFLVHGLGGHSGWYVGVGNRLAAEGLSVFIPDLRGFGRSGGERGHVSRGGQLLDDLEQMLAIARIEAGGAGAHLVGHSMGAALAVHLATRVSPETLALVNPWVEDAVGVSASIVATVALQGLVGSRQYWKLGVGPKTMTHHQEAHEFLAKDPYWVPSQTATFLTRILWLRLGLDRAAARIRTPALVIQTGEDEVVRHDASRRLFDSLAAEDRKWDTPPMGCHDFELDADPGPVADRLLDWIRDHDAGCLR